MEQCLRRLWASPGCNITPLPFAIDSISLLCLSCSACLVSFALESITAFVIPAAPPVKAPTADMPASRGMRNGK